MEPKEIVSMIVTLESDIGNLYDEFCNNEISRTSLKKQTKEIIEKQVDLINQFKKDVLTDFMCKHEGVTMQYGELVRKSIIDNLD